MEILNKRNQDSIVYKILLIEEIPQEFEFYTKLIHEVAQCKIDIISRGSDFLEWIDRSSYHLILVVECASGLTLLEHIKRMKPETSVILVSSQATVEQAVAAIRLGAEDFLSKPFNIDAFQLAVKRGLDKKMVFGENRSASKFINLLNSCQLISAALEERKIFETVQSYLLRELNAGYASIYSLQGTERGIDPVRVEGIETAEHYDRTLEEVLDMALRSANPLMKMSNSEQIYRFVERNEHSPAFFLFRFRCADKVDYFCACLSPERPQSMDAFESCLLLLKAQIEVTSKNIQKYIGVQQLVYVDDATGLYNTRYLNFILDREISQAQLTQKSFAVLFIDADRFKLVNDQYGHLAGTKLLNELGNHLKKYVRERDTLFRYGGDEFVAILSPCDLVMAKAIAERIRASVERKSFLKKEGLVTHFTISIGVALFPAHAKTKMEIIEVADQAMMSAKKTIRNSVSIAQMNTAEPLTKGVSSGR